MKYPRYPLATLPPILPPIFSMPLANPHLTAWNKNGQNGVAVCLLDNWVEERAVSDLDNNGAPAPSAPSGTTTTTTTAGPHEKAAPKKTNVGDWRRARMSDDCVIPVPD